MGLLISSLWRRLFTYKEFKVCLVGLDNAGKTTILFQLHMGEVVETQPTIGSNVEEVLHNNVRFSVWDLGGQESLRQAWATYFLGAHAVIVVVDSTDRARIQLVKAELDKLMHNAELSNAVLLVFANKQDIVRAATSDAAAAPAAASASAAAAAAAPAAASSLPASSVMTAAQIAEELNLQAIKDHSWHIQACCALTGEGLYEGIEWLTQAVTKA